MRTKRFETLQFARYEEAFRENIVDPVQAKGEIAKRMLSMGTDPAEVDRMASPTREDIVNSRVAGQWREGVALINAKHLCKVMHIKNGARWRYDNGVPRMLTAAQAAFALDGWPDSVYMPAKDSDKMVLVVARTGAPTTGLISPTRPTPEPLAAALQVAIDRIKRVLDPDAEAASGLSRGRWRTVRALAKADLATRQNEPGDRVTHYLAACLVCGCKSIMRKTAMDHKPCPTCERAKGKQLDKGVENATIVWISENSYQIGEEPPETATGKVYITKSGTPTAPMPLSDLDREIIAAGVAARLELERKLSERADEDTVTALRNIELEVAKVNKVPDEETELLEALRFSRKGRPRKFDPVREERLRDQRAKKAAAQAQLDKAAEELAEAQKAAQAEAELQSKLPTLPAVEEVEEEQEKPEEAYQKLVDGLELPNFD